jgi:ankyrin repeat protein
MSKELFAAVEKRAFKQICAAVEAGADVNAVEPDKPNSTALLLLCKSKSGEMSKAEVQAALWLIERGADVTKADSRGVTPLHHAAASGNHEVIDALIARGAKPALDRYGTTPLFSCLGTTKKDTWIWDRLIESGCDVNHVSGSGRTPLLEAQGSWNPVAVKYLLGRGADPAIKDKSGKTALDNARELKQDTIIPLLEAATK